MLRYSICDSWLLNKLEKVGVVSICISLVSEWYLIDWWTVTCWLTFAICLNSLNHHQIDILKSTPKSDGEEPESLPGHLEFIGPVNFAFLQFFWACQIHDGKCSLKHIAKAQYICNMIHQWKNITKWTWWNQHNERWRRSTITARPSRVHRTVNFAFLQYFWASQIHDGKWPLKHIANRQWRWLD